MSSNRKTIGLALVLLALLILSCGPSKKLRSVQTGEVGINIVGQEAPQDESNLPKYEIMRDTLRITGENGEELHLMKAIRDEESGEMVATDVLNAAVIIARFRHVAERHGKLDLYFQIQVPEEIRDSKWQIRITPELVIRNDTTDLHEVMITGSEYNLKRLRKYQLYEKMLKSILEDYDLIDRKREIEIFIERNLPEIYQMRLDSAYVTEEVYTTMYDVSQKEIIEHYGLDISKSRKRANERRIVKAEKMFESLTEEYPSMAFSNNIAMDTLSRNGDSGTWNLDFHHIINAEKGLRSVRMLLKGSVWESGRKIADIVNPSPYTFYISTLSGFYRPYERYVKKVLERRASANTSLDIQFGKGKSDIDPALGNNREELSSIKQTLSALMQNETYDLDSVVVTAGASPEGSAALNARLAGDRSHSISAYINNFTRYFQDSLRRQTGFVMNEEGEMTSEEFNKIDIPIRHRSVGEDWETLDRLVAADESLDEQQQKKYEIIRKTADPDAREARLKNEKFYPHLRDSLYPILRRVEFDFFLHRKGMVKDTIQTTELDTVYRRGLEALENMDYDVAVPLLEPYKDFNTAIAFMGVERNHAAAEILTGEPESADVEYLFAIIWSRLGDEQKAVQHYLNACKLDHSFVHRGNLDPEISYLIKTYNLNSDL